MKDTTFKTTFAVVAVAVMLMSCLVPFAAPASDSDDELLIAPNMSDLEIQTDDELGLNLEEIIIFLKEIGEDIGDYIQFYEQEFKGDLQSLISGPEPSIYNYDSVTTVKEGKIVDFAYGNAFVFTGSGALVFEEGSFAHFCGGFSLTGSNASLITMKAGSWIDIMGLYIKMPCDVVIALDGTFAFDLAITYPTDMTKGMEFGIDISADITSGGYLGLGDLIIVGGDNEEISVEAKAAIDLTKMYATYATPTTTDMSQIIAILMAVNVTADATVDVPKVKFCETILNNIKSESKIVFDPSASTGNVLTATESASVECDAGKTVYTSSATMDSAGFVKFLSGEASFPSIKGSSSFSGPCFYFKSGELTTYMLLDSTTEFSTVINSDGTVAINYTENDKLNGQFAYSDKVKVELKDLTDSVTVKGTVPAINDITDIVSLAVIDTVDVKSSGGVNVTVNADNFSGTFTVSDIKDTTSVTKDGAAYKMSEEGSIGTCKCAMTINGAAYSIELLNFTDKASGKIDLSKLSVNDITGGDFSSVFNIFDSFSAENSFDINATIPNGTFAVKGFKSEMNLTRDSSIVGSEILPFVITVTESINEITGELNGYTDQDGDVVSGSLDVKNVSEKAVMTIGVNLNDQKSPVTVDVIETGTIDSLKFNSDCKGFITILRANDLDVTAEMSITDVTAQSYPIDISMSAGYLLVQAPQSYKGDYQRFEGTDVSMEFEMTNNVASEITLTAKDLTGKAVTVGEDDSALTMKNAEVVIGSNDEGYMTVSFNAGTVTLDGDYSYGYYTVNGGTLDISDSAMYKLKVIKGTLAAEDVYTGGFEYTSDAVCTGEVRISGAALIKTPENLYNIPGTYPIEYVFIDFDSDTKSLTAVPEEGYKFVEMESGNTGVKYTLDSNGYAVFATENGTLKPSYEALENGLQIDDGQIIPLKTDELYELPDREDLGDNKFIGYEDENGEIYTGYISMPGHSLKLTSAYSKIYNGSISETIVVGDSSSAYFDADKVSKMASQKSVDVVFSDSTVGFSKEFLESLNGALSVESIRSVIDDPSIGDGVKVSVSLADEESIHYLGGVVYVSIPVPVGWDESKIAAGHVGDYGIEGLEFTIQTGADGQRYIVAETYELSDIIFQQVDTDVPEEKKTSGGSNNTALIVIAVIIILLLVVIAFVLKKRSAKSN